MTEFPASTYECRDDVRIARAMEFFDRFAIHVSVPARLAGACVFRRLLPVERELDHHPETDPDDRAVYRAIRDSLLSLDRHDWTPGGIATLRAVFSGGHRNVIEELANWQGNIENVADLASDLDDIAHDAAAADSYLGRRLHRTTTEWVNAWCTIQRTAHDIVDGPALSAAQIQDVSLALSEVEECAASLFAAAANYAQAEDIDVALAAAGATE